jgi:membrane associated rhomboid family serine protease
MGFADRDYYRDSPRRGGMPNFRAWSITNWLIGINVAVFVIDMLLQGSLSEWGYFSLNTAVFGWQVWRFITFQFLHANGQHILFNMIGLYFFGPFMESYLGTRRYLAFYLLCGIGGALGYILLNYLGFLHDGPGTPLIGASAGIFGILVGVALIAPDIPVMLMLIPIPMRMRTMALIYIGISVYTILTGGANAGGEAAHLGGAVVGLLLIQNTGLLNFADRGGPRMTYGGRRVSRKDWSKDMNR